MCPYRLPPPAVPEREGDFSSYSHVKSVVTTEHGISEGSNFLDNESMALVIGSYGNLLITTIEALDITSVSGESSSYRVNFNDHDKSVFNKYSAFVDKNNFYINIYKDGVKIDSIEVDVWANNDTWMGIAMSPSGEYILAIHKDNEVVDVYTLRLYKGA